MESAAGAISIIVLNHDKAAYTDACLRSVRQSSCRPLEIIAVDNGSSDGTGDVLTRFRDECGDDIAVQILSFSENIGAIRGRNAAMEVASGDYFVFIDNDILVKDRHWLEKLQAKLEAAPDIAVISPKLLFPWHPHDIEFAGCAVSPGGRIQYRGRGSAGDTPEFNTEQDVQCLISACIMFPRRLTAEIGVLDDAFSPVQYEDLDFCYRARQAGYRTVYTPDVEMYHFEHVTTDGSQDINFRYVTVKNGLEFKRRWKFMFENENGPPDAEVTWASLAKKGLQELEALPPVEG